jgi:hypothetical protein
MVFQRCSDVVESRAEQAIRDAESRSFYFGSEQPRRASLFGARGLLTTTRRGKPALSIDQLGDLSIAIL